MNRIKIKAHTAKLKDGRTFPAYQAVTNKGDLMDARFRIELEGPVSREQLPKTGTFWVDVEPGDYNINRRKEYPVVWFKAVRAVIIPETTAPQYTKDDPFAGDGGDPLPM